MGTVFCLKTVVPQTGNAVEGVCPSVVQGCANVFSADKTTAIKKRKLFMLREQNNNMGLNFLNLLVMLVQAIL